MNSKQIKQKLFIVFAVIFMLGCCRVGFAAVPDPISQMKEAVDEILVIMQDKSLGRPEFKQERRGRIVAIVKQHFDFREMSQSALAIHWKTLNARERDDFVELFTKLLEKTYIDRIDTYSDEKVVFKKQIVRGKKALVYSDFIKDNIEIPVNYKLKNNNDRWMVYDVVIEGVSFIRNYRTQFQSILDKEKYAGLISRMEEKVKAGEEEQ